MERSNVLREFLDFEVHFIGIFLNSLFYAFVMFIITFNSCKWNMMLYHTSGKL